MREYTPTHCQDKKLMFLRWIHHRVLKQLERRDPEGRPECQLLRHTPRQASCTSGTGATDGDKIKVDASSHKFTFEKIKGA
jgi:hypothetical protein